VKKKTNWDRYYKEQLEDLTTGRLVKEELKALNVGVQLARLREERGLTQTQLAAKVGMSSPNISRIESNPGQNLTLQSLVKLFGALDCDVVIAPRRRRSRSRRGSASV
jgi:DNA-binding Xre family transcriptional regulator